MLYQLSHQGSPSSGRLHSKTDSLFKKAAPILALSSPPALHLFHHTRHTHSLTTSFHIRTCTRTGASTSVICDNFSPPGISLCLQSTLHGNPLQYSRLENSWMEQPGGLQSMRQQRVRHDRATSLSESPDANTRFGMVVSLLLFRSQTSPRQPLLSAVLLFHVPVSYRPGLLPLILSIKLLMSRFSVMPDPKAHPVFTVTPRRCSTNEYYTILPPLRQILLSFLCRFFL